MKRAIVFVPEQIVSTDDWWQLLQDNWKGSLTAPRIREFIPYLDNPIIIDTLLLRHSQQFKNAQFGIEFNCEHFPDFADQFLEDKDAYNMVHLISILNRAFELDLIQFDTQDYPIREEIPANNKTIELREYPTGLITLDFQGIDNLTNIGVDPRRCIKGKIIELRTQIDIHDGTIVTAEYTYTKADPDTYTAVKALDALARFGSVIHSAEIERQGDSGKLVMRKIDKIADTPSNSLMENAINEFLQQQSQQE